MLIGFYSIVFREWDLEKLLKWSRRHNFQALEVYSGPNSKHINPEEILKGKAGEVKRAFEKSGIRISALAYYPNNIDQDEKKRKINNENIRKMIEAASQLDVNVICTFVGSYGNFFREGIEVSIKMFKEVFPPILDFAKEHDVKVAIENCPLGGWNIAFSPEVWDELFKVSNYIGLNFDPSHLVWQGIDYIDAINEYGNRIFHVHAKDTEILDSKLKRVGIYGKGWWRYRVPGWGIINWRQLITTLREVGYDHVLSIEMEDPIFRAEEGLILGLKFLSQLVYSPE